MRSVSGNASQTYHAYVSPTTILTIFNRHHVGPVSQKKYRPAPKRPDAPLQVPACSVQLDVKFVSRVGRARQRFYQFTAIDAATRFRVLRIYDHHNTKTAIDFLQEVQDHFPFAIQKIQTDNGSSFGPQFTWHVSGLRISHRHIPPGCPEVNAKVERSDETDSQEFYQGKHFKYKRDLALKSDLGILRCPADIGIRNAKPSKGGPFFAPLYAIPSRKRSTMTRAARGDF